MWLLVVFPPLVGRPFFRRPDRCDACGAIDPFVVHQWLERSLLSVAPIALAGPSSSAGATPSVSRYRAPRFRCTRCRKTVMGTPSAPTRVPRVPPAVRAWVVVPYSLGRPIAEIGGAYLPGGVRLERATLYRVLAAAEDGILRRLHRANRRRGIDVHPVRLYPQEPFQVSFTVAKAYGDGQFRETIDWLEGYCARVGGLIRSASTLDRLHATLGTGEGIESIFDGFLPDDLRTNLGRYVVPP